jgi:glucose-6-phosphate 1-dehydrogenase
VIESQVISDNPLVSKLLPMRQAGPFSLVIFGASGDLTKRKLIPALFNLYKDGFLPSPFSIVGFARREKSDEAFRAEMAQAVVKYSRRQPDSDDQLHRFVANLSYVQGEFHDEAAFARLSDKLKHATIARHSAHNCLFYLATPPDAFEPIILNLKSARLVSREVESNGWSRIIIEKPFGRDTTSAWRLNGVVHGVFSESQVFRIDHYLGKETVQNILVFRLGNSIFEPLWNRRYVDHVQISVAESIGIESRAGYFDSAGIIRDMIQSHIMQVFALIAMEPPASFDAGAIRDEKAKVLRSMHPFEQQELAARVIRGQYTGGSVGGETVSGYLNETGVPSSSTTDTFVALKCLIDNWRWSGVPFYIRAGKRLPKRVTEVSIVFKAPPLALFKQTDGGGRSPNILRLRIQPTEGISLSLGAKVPGQISRIAPVRMDFMYNSAFGVASPEAYERLILDAIIGDATLFAREDEVELSWQHIDRITNHWHTLPLHQYEAGTWGPAAADQMIAADGRSWVRL